MSENIKIGHTHLETQIVLDSDAPVVLIEENPKEFYYVVKELIRQLNGEEGDFVFSQNDKIISPEKYGYIINDIFTLDINDKKLINLLYKKLEKSVQDSDMISQFNAVYASVVQYLDDLIYLYRILLFQLFQQYH